ncbi:hypothetical protein K440DRAFT_646010 [Wilcoxina mikolae CBS 423.85]|nr:hypothetical protein K440DRAFT_646010 [Wilcoxina mikolae CBS 423.85]
MPRNPCSSPNPVPTSTRAQAGAEKHIVFPLTRSQRHLLKKRGYSPNPVQRRLPSTTPAPTTGVVSFVGVRKDRGPTALGIELRVIVRKMLDCDMTTVYSAGKIRKALAKEHRDARAVFLNSAVLIELSTGQGNPNTDMHAAAACVAVSTDPWRNKYWQPQASGAPLSSVV